jgi:hypothetical protein
VFVAPLALAAPVPKGLKKLAPSFDGHWHLVESIEDGAPRQITGNYCRNVLISGEGLASRILGWPQACNEPLTLIDPARPHLRLWNGKPAVLVMEGDSLRFYFATDGRKELTEGETGSGVSCYVYHRRSEEK